MAYLIDSGIMVDFTRGAAEAVDYLQTVLDERRCYHGCYQKSGRGKNRQSQKSPLSHSLAPRTYAGLGSYLPLRFSGLPGKGFGGSAGTTDLAGRAAAVG